MLSVPIVTATQRYLDDEFAANPNPPAEALGATKPACDRSGQVEAGDLLACAGTLRTAPSFDLDPVGGVRFAVLDDAGTVAWTTGTDLPQGGQRLDGLIASATPGLDCRDLVDPDAQAQTGFFDATSTNDSFGHFLSSSTGSSKAARTAWMRTTTASPPRPSTTPTSSPPSGAADRSDRP